MPRTSTTWKAGEPRPKHQQPSRRGRPRRRVGLALSLDETRAILTLFGDSKAAVRHLGLDHPVDRVHPSYAYKILRSNRHDPPPDHAVLTVAHRWRAWVSVFLRNPWPEDHEQHRAWARGVCRLPGVELPFTIPGVYAVDARPTGVPSLDAVVTPEDVFFPSALFATAAAAGTRLGLGYAWFWGKRPGTRIALAAKQQLEEQWQRWADAFLVFPNRREDWWHPDLREKDGSLSKFHADEPPFTWPAAAPREPIPEDEVAALVRELRVDPVDDDVESP